MSKKHIFDDPANVRRLLRVFFAICGLLILLDLLELAGFHFKHAKYAVEGWFGFYGIYGFVGCVVLVLTAKLLRKIVMRGEDYYDR